MLMSQLDLTLFGTPRIEIDSQAVHIARRKATALLAYLTVTGVRHNRDSLATLLWPEKGQSSARAELRRGLYFINKALGNQWLRADLETIGLNPELNTSSGTALWLDVAEFQQQLKACEKHEHPTTETCPDCIPHLETAVDLYTDHFMTGFSLPDSPVYDEWQFFQTEGLRSQLTSTLLRLSSFYTSASRQDFETAIRYARRWLTLDPLHEPAHQHLMTLFAQSGQRVKAIRQYQECAHILDEDLGISPSKETSALYERIQTDQDFPENHVIRRELIEIPRKPGSAIAKTQYAGWPDGISLRDKKIFQQIEDFIGIFLQISMGLERLHAENIIHGNLRPGHITIKMDGTVVLTGLESDKSRDDKILLDREFNQIAYLAPEQILGHRIDFRTDLYALGVLLYEISTGGQQPFQAEDRGALISQILHAPLIPPRVRNTDIPPNLDKLIRKLLRKDPMDRPNSTKEVRQVLQNPVLLLEMKKRPTKQTLLDRIVRGQIIGRAAELKRTQILWQDTLTSAGQTLLIGGEPGVGKTRLMREVVAQAVASGGITLVGACYAQGNDTYEAFQQIIRQGFRRYPDLHKDLPSYVMGELIRLTPRLANHYPEFPENPPLEPNAEQRRLVESMVTFCQALSDRSPVLLAVEDLHWADGDTLSLFHTLARRTRRKRIMLLGTYRDTKIETSHLFDQVLVDLNRERLTTEISLSRLDHQRTGELLTALFAEETPLEFLDGIYHQTEGNPFFVEEVCKALVENGQLKFGDGKWHLPAMKTLQIPPSVRSAIHSRVEDLADEVQETLMIGAIQGREFDFQALSVSSTLAEDNLIEALENAESAQLIEETSSEYGGSFSFSHALIPAALTEGLSGLRKRKLHRQAALAIQEIHPESYQRLAYHWGAGGDVTKALTYTIKAAEQASQRYAVQDAIRLYIRAIDLLPSGDEQRFDLLAARANAYDIIADREAQLGDIEAMLKLAEAGKDQTREVDALLALGKLYFEIDKFKVKEPAERALDISRKIGDTAREARTSFLMCQDRRYLNEIICAMEYLENAVAFARAAGNQGELAEYLSYNAMFFGHIDDDKRLAMQLEALVLSQEIGDKRLEMLVKKDLAELYIECNQPEEALSIAESVLQASSEMGDIDCRLNILHVLAITKIALGLLDEAEIHLQEILQDPYMFSASDFLHVMYSILPLYIHTGEYEKGLILFIDLLDRAHQEGASEYWIMEIQYFYQACWSILGKYKESLEINAKNVPDYFKTDVPSQAAVVTAIMARAAAMLGDFELAQDYLEQAFEYCVGLEESLDYGFVLIMSAEVAGFDGRPEVVQKGLEQHALGLQLLQKNHWTLTYRDYYIAADLFMTLVPDNPSYATGALASIENAIDVYEKQYILHTFWPLEKFFITASQAYRANQQPDKADEYLNQAYDRLLLVAGNTKDDELRHSYLENVPWNRQILTEAKAFGIAS
jgi:predicted ATPase/DNA-binding SARP family transcriptional activator